MDNKERVRIIAEMGETQGWKLFKEDIERLIESSTPKNEFIEGHDAVKTASKVVFANGLRRALRAMELNKKLAKI